MAHKNEKDLVAIISVIILSLLLLFCRGMIHDDDEFNLGAAEIIQFYATKDTTMTNENG